MLTWDEQALKRQACEWIEAQPEAAYVRMIIRSKGESYRSRFMPPGMPDVIVCWLGRFRGFEFKRPANPQISLRKLGPVKNGSGRTSAAQLEEHAMIRRALGECYVVDSLEQVIAILKPNLLPPSLRDTPMRCSACRESYAPLRAAFHACEREGMQRQQPIIAAQNELTRRERQLKLNEIENERLKNEIKRLREDVANRTQMPLPMNAKGERL